jgi:hypothetical protein
MLMGGGNIGGDEKAAVYEACLGGLKARIWN